MRGLLPDVGNADAGDKVGHILVLNGAGAGANDKAAHPLRMPGRVVERDETAAGDAQQMKGVKPQMLGQRVQIGGDAA